MASQVTHTMTRSYRAGTNPVRTQTETITCSAENNYKASIPAGSYSVEVDWAVDRSKLKSLSIYSDQAIEIYTNGLSSGSPVDHLIIPAGKNLMWSLAFDGLTQCPFTASVTALYFQNLGASAANVEISAAIGL